MERTASVIRKAIYALPEAPGGAILVRNIKVMLGSEGGGGRGRGGGIADGMGRSEGGDGDRSEGSAGNGDQHRLRAAVNGGRLLGAAGGGGATVDAGCSRIGSGRGGGDYSEGGAGGGAALDGDQLERGGGALKGDLQRLRAAVNMGRLLGAAGGGGATVDADCSRVGSEGGAARGAVRDGDQLERRGSALKGDQHRRAAEDGGRLLGAAAGGFLYLGATMAADCLEIGSGRGHDLCDYRESRAEKTGQGLRTAGEGECSRDDASGRGDGRGPQGAAARGGSGFTGAHHFQPGSSSNSDGSIGEYSVSGNGADDSGNSQGEHDCSRDLYLAGRPVPESWRRIWEASPLVLHDRVLLQAKEDLGIFSGDGAPNLTSVITSVLVNHPGPVSCFRIDSSTWSHGTDQLSHWMKILSRKGASEFVLINLACPTDLEFPLDELQCSILKILRLGFLRMPELNMFSFYHTPSLRVLQFISCKFSEHGLYAAIESCKTLVELQIGFSDENMRIRSDSLELIQIWQSSGSRLVIEDSPKLKVLVPGFRPSQGLRRATVSINGTPSLKEILHIALPLQTVIIDNVTLSEASLTFPCLRTLRVGIRMSDTKGRSRIRSVLEALPALSSLTLWRMDEISLDEGVDAFLDFSLDDLGAVTCVKTKLEFLEIDDFRGGAGEVYIAQSILRDASCLKKLVLRRHVNSTTESTNKAITKIKSSPKACSSCDVKSKRSGHPPFDSEKRKGKRVQRVCKIFDAPNLPEGEAITFSIITIYIHVY
uniref:FBD domain-containing protein n=1 Tax=Oryza punctata TaxID=4537 RepID=A0A0E0MJJ8_ORYPU